MSKKESAPAAAPRVQTVQLADAMFTAAVERSAPRQDSSEGITDDNRDELIRLEEDAPATDREGYEIRKTGRIDEDAAARLKQSGSVEDAADALATALREADPDADVDVFDEEADSDPEDGDEAEDGDEDADGDEDGDEDSETYRVKVDGEEVEVTLEEALKGYQRQSTFTKRMQQVAETRREAESLREQAGQGAHQYAMLSAALLQFADQALPAPVKAQMQASVQRAIADLEAVHAHKTQETLRTEAKALREAMGWQSDADVAAGRQALVQAAKAYGYEPQELSSVYDHRLLVILNDAARYREMQGKGKDAQAAAKATRKRSPTLPPGTTGQRSTARGKAQKANRARLASSGSLSDAAAVLEGLLDG
jgi:hypothetical protein